MPPALFDRLVLAPNRALVRRVRALGATAPIIGFPREAGAAAPDYARETGVQGMGVDTAGDARWLRAALGPKLALQGALDPQALLAGGAALEAGVRETLEAFAGGPHIFNLGHGITPEVPPEHVARLVSLAKGA